MDRKSETTETDRVGVYYKAMAVTAVIAGFVAAVLVVGLTVNYIQGKVVEPSLTEQLAGLKLIVKEQPDNASVVEHMRQLDLELRRITFRRLDRTRRGSLGLLISLAIVFFSMKFAWNVAVKLPCPTGDAELPETQKKRALFARRSVTAAMLIASVWVIFIFVGEGVDYSEVLEDEGAQAGGSVVEGPKYPTDEEIKANWASFRGPGGLGIAVGEYLTEFDVKAGTGVLWKTAVPINGMSSPVVWGDRVFLTGADEQQRQVYCYDAAKGDMLWVGDMSNVPGRGDEEVEVMEDTGFAAPTAVTDGKHVCVIFANGYIGCFDYAGKRLWAKNLGVPDSIYGFSASLAMYQDRVIVQYDQGGSDENRSKLISMNISTGSIVWQFVRPVANSWPSPTVINIDGTDTILTCSDPYAIAYEAGSGKEIWRAECIEGDIASTPIYAGGFVFAIEPYSHIAAIRTDGTGDVTETHIAWKGEDEVPDVCSPISDGNVVITLTTEGVLICYSVADGGMLWEHEIDGFFNASPVIAGDKMYLIEGEGKMIVATFDDGYKEVAVSEIGEVCLASPAFVDGRIYIRSKENLYCIGE